MLKSTKYLFFVFISQLIVSCQTTTIDKNMANYSKKEDKTLAKPFVIEWDLDKNYITNLPKESKIEAQKHCHNRKIILLKLFNENLDRILSMAKLTKNAY